MYIISFIDFLSSFADAIGEDNTTNINAIASERISSKSYSLQELYKILQQSSVTVEVYDSVLGPKGLGSGFIINEKGNLVTNYHVAKPPQVGKLSYDITFANGDVFPARLIGSDSFTDLAVLKIENSTIEKFIPLKLGNSSNAVPGDKVAVYGAPSGLSGSLTTGIISAVGRGGSDTSYLPVQLNGMTSTGLDFSQIDMIQTDATINHGNSGGPVVDIYGEVIGVSDLGLADFGIEHTNFLIPSNTVKRVTETLLKGQKYFHPWLGINGMDITPRIASEIGLPNPHGVLVADVYEDSPAERSGLIPGSTFTFISSEGRYVPIDGDVIWKLDDKEIKNQEDVLKFIELEKKINENIKITVYRNNELVDLNTKLTSRPSLD